MYTAMHRCVVPFTRTPQTSLKNKTNKKTKLTYILDRELERETVILGQSGQNRRKLSLTTDRYQIPQKADTFWKGCLVGCWTLLLKTGLLTSISIRLCIKERKRLFSQIAPENKLLDPQSVCYASLRLDSRG